MICVEGYKAFRGTMYHKMLDKKITGEWLYKPDTDCWYCNGSSYPNVVLKIIDDLT